MAVCTASFTVLLCLSFRRHNELRYSEALVLRTASTAVGHRPCSRTRCIIKYCAISYERWPNSRATDNYKYIRTVPICSVKRAAVVYSRQYCYTAAVCDVRCVKCMYGIGCTHLPVAEDGSVVPFQAGLGHGPTDLCCRFVPNPCLLYTSPSPRD